MKREPSIHIGQSLLTDLIHEYLVDSQGNVVPEELSGYLLVQSRSKSLRHRSIVNPDLKTHKVTSRIAMSPKLIAYEFSKLLTLARKRSHHRGISVVTEKDGVQWQFIVEASALATEFCKSNNLDIRAGFIEYIDIAIKLIKPFTINRVKSNHDRIEQYYITAKEIQDDPNPIITQTIFDSYQQKVFERTQVNLNYRELPLEYVNFVRAAAIAKELDLHGTHFVSAQFDQLDFTNGYPTPNQLSSFKAKERALRWSTETGVKVKKEVRVLDARQQKFINKFKVK